MRNRIGILAIILLVGPAYSGEELNCDNPLGGYEHSDCANIKYKAADKSLNEAFKKVKARMSKEQVKLLVTAQKGWLTLRDNQCALEVFATRGTTGNNAEYLDCLRGLTELRSRQLESTPTDSTLE